MTAIEGLREDALARDEDVDPHAPLAVDPPHSPSAEYVGSKIRSFTSRL